MPKKGIPLSRQKSSRKYEEGRTNSPPLHNWEGMSNETFATTTQLNKDPWGSDAEYEEIMTNELKTEVSQPNEPPISGKRIVNIASLLQRVIKVSENHARTCTSGSLSIDKEIRRGLESTIVLKCMMCEKTFTCSTIDLKYENINKEAVWGTLSIGSTFKHTEEFLSVLNIPPLSGTTFYTLQEELSQKTFVVTNTEIYETTNEPIASKPTPCEKSNSLLETVSEGPSVARTNGPGMPK
ncbi:hypothetical protein FQR65_LT14570 [Abscondita terminalis]|nr:hypothetical protein FQR65_LT14570 [Abscondita terminalis]